jgi:hypothetical protein
MKYRTILLLNVLSLAEACLIKFLIGKGILVCNLSGMDTLYGVVGLVAVKNILTLGGYQMYFWPQRNYGPEKNDYYSPLL